ncbi:MAG: hypothetical protein ACR2GD_08980, partial [Pyrinomonadaceae bacterium]
PAGTGMRYYRNVEVDYDNTVEKKQERDYDDIPLLTGGIDLPDSQLDIPLVGSEDMDGFSIEDKTGEPLIGDSEVFDMEDVVDDFDDEI